MSIKKKLKDIAAALGCVHEQAHIVSESKARRINLIEGWIEDHIENIKALNIGKRVHEQDLDNRVSAIHEEATARIQEIVDEANQSLADVQEQFEQHIEHCNEHLAEQHEELARYRENLILEQA